MIVIGLMSGTSMDGIDAGILRTDGEAKAAPVAAITLPYEESFRGRLRAAVQAGTAEAGLERELTHLHARAVDTLLRQDGFKAGAVELIGFHGHTIFHAPAQRRTHQIGDGALLARLTGIAVVNDFRSADVSAGGEGAPLVPVFHRAIAAEIDKPVAMLNIGGVANVTWIGQDGALLAFDTGPGNALIDDWVLHQAGRAFDEGGALAQSGRADARAVASFIEQPYFKRPPPKSLDRNAFAALRELLAGSTPQDGAATLTHATAAAVAAALAHLPEPPKRWLVTGGGRRNLALMRALAERLGAPVDPVESMGWDGDGLEAFAFAYLAARSRKGLPLSFPETTGVPRPLTGGRFHAAPRR